MLLESDASFVSWFDVVVGDPCHCWMFPVVSPLAVYTDFCGVIKFSVDSAAMSLGWVFLCVVFLVLVNFRENGSDVAQPLTSAKIRGLPQITPRLLRRYRPILAEVSGLHHVTCILPKGRGRPILSGWFGQLASQTLQKGKTIYRWPSGKRSRHGFSPVSRSFLTRRDPPVEFTISQSMQSSPLCLLWMLCRV